MTSKAGRPATRPRAGWKPKTRRRGLVVTFVSEDGAQTKQFDFGRLPGNDDVRKDLAIAFAAATGPLGTSKRLAGAGNLWQAARQACFWLSANRPRIASLAELSPADAKMLALSFRVQTGSGLMPSLKALLLCSPVVSDDVHLALSRMRRERTDKARQPYSESELRKITVAARGIVRRARDRLQRNWQVVADYRAGVFDGLPEKDPTRSLGEALDYCARNGDFPRSPSGAQAAVTRRAVVAAGGSALLPLLHLSAGEAWAFGVLIAACTGLNLSVIRELPAPHEIGSAPDETGILFLSTNKPRRGLRSSMTIPVTAFRPELRPYEEDSPRAGVLNTSLTTAYGVFTLLLTLTEHTREVTNHRHAFMYYNGCAGYGPSVFGHGISNAFLSGSHRRGILEPWLTGEADNDGLLLNISMDRLRKTFLERVRKPVSHTPATLARYLSRMDSVTEDGFQIVREALDEEITKAKARRAITVDTTGSGDVADKNKDTVLGECVDISNSPFDGRPCRRSFMTCLDCTNARAFPRHLPMQLVVLERLDAERGRMPIDQWVVEHGGRAAQLRDIIEEYQPSQVLEARASITDEHRRTVGLLFSGHLEAS
jgi:hypothetical protein